MSTIQIAESSRQSHRALHMVQTTELERFMPELPLISSSRVFPDWTSISARIYRLRAGSASLPAVPDPCVTVYSPAPGVRLKRVIAGHVEETTLFPGAISILPANQAVTWEWDGFLEMIQLHINSAYLRDMERNGKLMSVEIGVLDNVVTSDPLVEQIGNRIAGLLRTGGGDVSPGYLQSFTALLVAHLAEQYHQDSKVLGLAKTGNLDGHLSKAIVFIHENLDRDLPLEQVAKAADLSRFHFHRRFKLKIGQSPRAYVLEHRLNLAKHLLTRTATPINRIVERCGFRAHSYFTTVFRKSTGKTPREYRRTYSKFAAWATVALCSALAFLMSASTSGGMYLESCLAST